MTTAASGAAWTVDGLQLENGGTLNMAGLDLACLPAPDAITSTTEARARFERALQMQTLQTRPPSFVVLARDPVRSVVDPPPLFCRALEGSFTLEAPLVRRREPAARWLVQRLEKGLADDTQALVASAHAQKLTALAAPRVLVDANGSLVAVVLPVESD